jgi:septum formation protein
MALAYLKAAAAHKSTDTRRLAPGELVVLGADTVVVKRSGDETEFIGQPRDAADAERILRRLANGEHEVVTGVALVDAATGRRDLFCDRATVRVGAISEDTLAAYLASGEWAGKAGAYNLAERIEAGWPIEFDGDPATIMGLPMRMLPDRLRRFAETSAPCAAA